jgi:hypothetical protein
MHTHSCIKCNQSYQSKDEDAYYCETCNKARLAIAAQVDAQVASRPSKREAPGFEERMAGFKSVRGIPMVNLPKHGGKN